MNERQETRADDDDQEAAETMLKGGVGASGIMKDRANSETTKGAKKNVSFSDDLQINRYFDENLTSSSNSRNKWKNYRQNLLRSNKMRFSKSSPNSFSKQSEGVFCSYQFHVIVIICVILVLLCITGELLVMSIDLASQNEALRYAQTHPTTRAYTQAPGPFNAPPVLSPNSLAGIKKLLFNLSAPGSVESTGVVSLKPGSENQDTMAQENSPSSSKANSTRALQVLARIFRYLGLTIVSIFITEYIIKSISYPRIFIKYKMEIIEIIVTIISFVMNIVLIERQHVVHAIASILVVFR